MHCYLLADFCHPFQRAVAHTPGSIAHCYLLADLPGVQHQRGDFLLFLQYNIVYASFILIDFFTEPVPALLESHSFVSLVYFPGVQHWRSFYAPSCRLPHNLLAHHCLCFRSADCLLSGTCTTLEYSIVSIREPYHCVDSLVLNIEEVFTVSCRLPGVQAHGQFCTWWLLVILILAPCTQHVCTNRPVVTPLPFYLIDAL